jgi:hypothetical protein
MVDGLASWIRTGPVPVATDVSIVQISTSVLPGGGNPREGRVRHETRPAAEHLVDQPRRGMAAMAMPAIWQLSGYVIALLLPTGFRGIPRELREAAAMDGASTYCRTAKLSELTPVTLSVLIIVGLAEFVD